MNKISVNELKGVGKKREEQLAKLGIKTIGDLLLFLPREYKDLTSVVNIKDAKDGDLITFQGEFTLKPTLKRMSSRFNVVSTIVELGGISIKCEWYNQPWKAKQIKIQNKYLFIGRLYVDFYEYKMKNPTLLDANDDSLPKILPIYKLTAGIRQKTIRSLIGQALDKYCVNLKDNLPRTLRERLKLAEINFSYNQIHRPTTLKNLELAKRRLATEEMLIFLCAIRLIKDNRQNTTGISIKVKDKDTKSLSLTLPYELTGAQKRTIDSVMEDLFSDISMNRLIQGDVGSGKTIVAILALYAVVKQGFQGAMMAPTEILASQHFHELTRLLAPFHIKVGILTGSLNAKERKLAYENIESGEWDIVVGTHALIQDKLIYKNLGLIITDEQHRFGVKQRSILSKKAFLPNTIVMSATPVPRTLALILYGDLDISIIDELPPGRIPIITRLVRENKRDDLYRYLAAQIANGQQIYIICPLVEDSLKVEAMSATSLYKKLIANELRDARVGLIHGRISSEDKENKLNMFKNGELDVLVSTTVIEVGIDVPNATIMVIENSERFGLSQLHQLRGRVGRGKKQSWCFLCSDTLNEVSAQRLNILVNNSDGFIVAEKDLELRGPGEFLGTKQSGLIDPRVIMLFKDSKALAKAKIEIDRIFSKPNLTKEKLLLTNAATIRYRDILSDIIFN